MIVFPALTAVLMYAHAAPDTADRPDWSEVAVPEPMQLFSYQVCVTSGAEYLAFQSLEAGSVIVERAFKECDQLRNGALRWVRKFPKRYASEESDPTKAAYFEKIAENPERFLAMFDEMMREKLSVKVDRMHADPDVKLEQNPQSALTEKESNAQD